MAATEELFKAIAEGDREAVARLVEEEPRLVDARSKEGMSALITAVYYQKKEIADLLLERGAKPDIFAAAAAGLSERVEELARADKGLLKAYSPDGWTALHLAAHFDREDAVRALICLGADHRAVAKNAIANQPLQAAAAGRASKAIAVLIQAGAEVDALSHSGVTAVHSAAQNGDVVSLRLLLDAGADVDLPAEGGKTPLDFGRGSKSDEVVRLIESRGGKPGKSR